MQKFSMSNFTKNIGMVVSKRSPELLTGAGIAGMIATTILAVEATPKAIYILEEAKEEHKCIREYYDDAQDKWVSKESSDPLTRQEIISLTWKCYIPATVIGVLSISCLIGACMVNSKRKAALALAYTLSDTALREYREKVREEIGEKREQSIRDKVSEDRIHKNPLGNNEVIITDKGHTLCYDTISGRYFKSDIDKIKKAENELNKTLLHDMYVSLNSFYDELGLSHTSLGDELGWNSDHGLVDIEFSAHISEDGEPCLVLDYSIAPKHGYYNFV